MNRLRDARPPARTRRNALRPNLLEFEARTLLAAPAVPAVVVDSASTADSRGVTVDYDVNDASAPLAFGVYRSADATLDGGDAPVAAPVSIAPGTLDASGGSATAVGHHELTVPLPGGLPPVPERPYVLVAADPAAALATGDPRMVGSFRKAVIGVVVHGGIENPAWKNGPAWELKMAESLRREGYDAVIPYNWVSQSSTPGDAVKQSPRLLKMVLADAAKFPAGEPVDLHLIGHSEGAVIASQTAQKLEASIPANLKAGYLELTLLDPHSANNGVRGEQYSVGHGVLGLIARGVINHYQSRAKDPFATVPAGVDGAEVFYQHTTVQHSSDFFKLENLWGQVPVRGGPASYFDLTEIHTLHSGHYGVQAWYQEHVVPSLGQGGVLTSGSALSVHLATATASAGSTTTTMTHRPTFAGTGAPGTRVRVQVAPAATPDALTTFGRTRVAADGTWSVRTRPLPDGRYRVLALAATPPGPLHTSVPVAPLGPALVEAAPRHVVG